MQKIIRYLKPFWWMLILVTIFVFTQAITSLYLPNLMSDIVDVGIVQNDKAYIWRTGGIMLIVAFLGTVAMIFASYFSARIGVGLAKKIRSEIFKRVEGYSLNVFDKIGTSSLITRTTNDVTQIQNVTVMFFRMMLQAPLLLVGGVIMAVRKDAKLSLILVVVLPVLAIAIGLIASKGIPLFKVMQKKIDRINLVMRERLTGIRVIRAFNRIEHEQERFHEANEDLTMTTIKVNRIMGALMPGLMLVMNVTTVAVIWFGGIRIDQGNMQVGDLMAFIQYVMQIMFSLIMASMMFIFIPRAQASAVRINEVLESPVEVFNDEEKATKFDKKGHLKFEDVSFKYEGAEECVLRNISFDSAPGETTAIIGGTGSGKSSLVNLVARFYDIASGAIYLNGENIKDLGKRTLRDRIGVVPQKNILFSGTIRENILYGNKEANDAQILEALEVAQAKEFVEALDDKLDHMVAQGGTNLSGGQKQRLAIARAIVRNPEVYIFDDSFSALDFKTAKLLKKALFNKTKEASVLIVAQRVTSVMDADRIIVLDEGEIAGAGSHEELINSCEVYKEIVNSQMTLEEQNG